MHRINIDELTIEHDPDRPEGFRAGMHHLGPEVGALRTIAGIFELPPGQALSPYHFEYGTEHWVLVMEGRPSVRTADDTIELAPHDLVFFPAGVDGAHQLRNDSHSAVRMVALGEMFYPAVTAYPDSGKVGVWTGIPGDDLIVRRSSEVDYFDGETRDDT